MALLGGGSTAYVEGSTNLVRHLFPREFVRGPLNEMWDWTFVIAEYTVIYQLDRAML